MYLSGCFFFLSTFFLLWENYVKIAARLYEESKSDFDWATCYNVILLLKSARKTDKCKCYWIPWFNVNAFGQTRSIFCRLMETKDRLYLLLLIISSFVHTIGCTHGWRCCLDASQIAFFKILNVPVLIFLETKQKLAVDRMSDSSWRDFRAPSWFSIAHARATSNNKSSS